MKKLRKILKILIISFAFLIAVGTVFLAFYYYDQTKSVALDKSKLDMTNVSIEIFDKNGTSIKPTSENYIEISKLSNQTINAFISAEDKRFYAHKGLDFIRIGGAIISNIKNRSFSQGASTISQQLVKNTHLTNEKTISRKLKEIKLTKSLESNYSKSEILELYLNNIYFGNGCYGIENAANHYFSKSAKNLTLAESAILAGTINAPSLYDIESNLEKANARKNLILQLMFKYGKISEEEKEKAKNETIKLNISKLSNYNYIYNEIIEEACIRLGLSENQVKNNNIKIYSYIDLNVQNQVNKIINESYNNIEENPNIASIILDNENSGIVAIKGSKNILNSKRQPGSTIKPILVYAPAFENETVTPATKINDEKINISGYSPENADKKYHGSVSVREALKNSYNIPAVKLLNEIGIDYAQNFAKKMGITFSKEDKNLAIALGGFTDGLSLMQLSNAYKTFANNGYFSEAKYISKIIKNQKVLYENKSKSTRAMSESTAYMITDILQDASTTGTAKRLKNFDFDIASKTGTVGISNSSKNSDAYNISYTTKHTILSYVGGTKMPESINGATIPTMLTKDILSYLYSNSKPHSFIIPDSVKVKKISKNQYNDNNLIILADDNEDSINEIFNKNTAIPKNEQINFNIEVYNLKNKKPIVSFYTSDRYTYNIIRKKETSEEIISSEDPNNIYKQLNNSDTKTNIDNNELLNNLKNKSKAQKAIFFEDKSAKSDEIYEYFVEFIDKNTKNIYKSNNIKLKVF